jgi:hypothetical protein
VDKEVAMSNAEGRWRKWGSVLVGVVAGALVSVTLLAGGASTSLTAVAYSDVIRFEVAGAVGVQIQIYDLSERELWNSGPMAGDFADWDRTDQWGGRLANGYYIYLVQAWADDESLLLKKSGKVVLLPGDKVQLQAVPTSQSPAETALDILPIDGSPFQPRGLGDTGVFGSVGIGTASPTYLLHIQTTTNAGAGFVERNSSAGTGAYAFFTLMNDSNHALQGHVFSTTYSSASVRDKARLRASGAAALMLSTGASVPIEFQTADTTRMTLSGAGDLGIGTTSPATKLDVYSTTGAGASSDGIVNIGQSSGYHLTFDANDIQAKNGTAGESTLYLNFFGGNVAVGGIVPTYRLDVEGDRIRLNNPSDAREVMLRVDGAANDLQAENADLYIRSNGGYDIHMNPYDTDGAVVVGDTDKAGTVLFVNNNDATTGVATVQINNAESGGFGDLLSGYNGADREFFFNYLGDLYLDGTTMTPADFAELMKVEGSADAFEPGDVLVILPSGRLALSSAPYSTSLVGVYSTKPGVQGDYTSMEMAEDEPEAVTEARKAAQGPRVPVALLGIVPVKACAENGAIRPGDVLTTSSTPGHAMKASPVLVGGVQIYPTGAILGKALEPLEAGTGTILALITLR